MRRFAIAMISLILAGCAVQVPPTAVSPPVTATARPAGIVDCQVRDATLAQVPRGTLATLTMSGGWVYDDSSTLAVNVDGTLAFSLTQRTWLFGNGTMTNIMTETVNSFSGVAPAADLQRLQSLIASPAFGAIKDCPGRIPAADGGASYLSIIDVQGEQTFALSEIEPPVVLQEIRELVQALIGSATTLQSSCVYTRVDFGFPVLQSCEK